MSNSENFKSLAENDAFLEKLISAKTDEEIKSVFKEQGVEISDKEIENLKKSFQQKMSEELKKLPEDQLSDIAGGTLGDVAYDGAKGALNGVLFGTVLGGIVGTVKILKSDESLGRGVKHFLTTMAKGAVAGALLGGTVGAGMIVAEEARDRIDDIYSRTQAHQTNK